MSGLSVAIFDATDDRPTAGASQVRQGMAESRHICYPTRAINSIMKDVWIDPFLYPPPERTCTGREVMVARTGLIKIVRRKKTKKKHWPLKEKELDRMAEARRWDKISGLPEQPPMASYKRDEVRLNFWLSTGTVGSYLQHPRQGKTQLFRKEIDMSKAGSVFDNPRQHTGKGYHKKNGANGDSEHGGGSGGDSGNKSRKRKAEAPADHMRTCSECSRSKSNDEFSKNQRRKGSAARCKSCI